MRRLAVNGLASLVFLSATPVVAHAADPAIADSAPSSGSFSVRAMSRRADGNPWRGSPPDFGVMGPERRKQDAPSLVLCTVSVGGEVACPGSEGTDSKGRPRSPCRVSYDCDFDVIALPQGPWFGVVVISTDLLQTHFVDAVIFSRQPAARGAAAVVEFDAQLHRAAEQLAPAKGPYEPQRRARRFQLFDASGCAEPCQLRQSDLALRPAEPR